MKKISVLVLALMMLLSAAWAEEEYSQIYVDFDAYDFTGERGITVETEWDGDLITEQYGGIGIMGWTGMTVGECMENNSYFSLRMEAEGFEGWMLYENVITMDEFGFEESEYVKLPDEKLYTTEEILAMELPEHHLVIVAKWEDVPAEDYFADIELGLDDMTISGAFSLLAEGGEITFHDGLISGSYTYWLEAGQTLQQLIDAEEGWSKAVSAQKEGAVFTGWTVYQAENMMWGFPAQEEGTMSWLFYPDDEGGTYIVLQNPVLISENATTEELYAMVVEEMNYLALANWG